MSDALDEGLIATLRAGRTVFFPGGTNRVVGAYYTYMRRHHGLYFHSRIHVHEGVSGLMAWADDEPPAHGPYAKHSFLVLG